MSPSEKLTIGILGGANIAIRSIVPAIQELNNLFEIAGIASRDKDKADQLATRFGVSPCYSYQELIENIKPDAIYIPLPNSMHAEWVQKSLEAGIHVLVEKSLSCEYNEVLALNHLAEQKELALIENFQFRFHSQLKEIIRIANSGAIGELRCMRSSFGFPPFPDANNIRYQAELGGGALLDAGAYPIKISQIFLGEDIQVEAATMHFDQSRGVDIWGGGFIRQKSGDLFCEFAFGFDHFYQCNIELWGSKGKLHTNRIFTSPPGYQPEITLEDKEGVHHIKLEQDNHFKNMLNHFYQVINGILSAKAEYEQNINQARLINEFKIKANG